MTGLGRPWPSTPSMLTGDVRGQVAAYFVSHQMNTTVIYSDILPGAGSLFLDRSKLLSAILGITLGGAERPVLNLDFLLGEVVRKVTPLDWERFWENNKLQVGPTHL
jgi:hypothetical protein